MRRERDDDVPNGGDGAEVPRPAGHSGLPGDVPPPEAFFDDEDAAERWDREDPRRKDDQMAPPTEPCECYCLHCGRTFMSDGIWFQRVVGDPAGFPGFWMCPTPNCGGAGFTFDIFPTDPSHPANAGWHYFDDDEDGVDDEEDDDEDEDEDLEQGVDGAAGRRPPREDGVIYDDDEGSTFVEDFDAAVAAGGGAGRAPGASPDDDWDPDETKYKQMDEWYGDEDDDLEGEEWKYGLEPGERPAGPRFHSEADRREWEEEQAKYDRPDERPRELDWSNREDRKDRDHKADFTDDDIPF